MKKCERAYPFLALYLRVCRLFAGPSHSDPPDSQGCEPGVFWSIYRQKRLIARGKLSQYIINNNHILLLCTNQHLLHIKFRRNIYIFLYNTVDQIFLRVREEDQVTLFGAKMLGFPVVKIENVPLLFSRMQTCFKGLFLIHHILYCLLIIFVMKFMFVKVQQGCATFLMPTVLNSRQIYSLFWFWLCHLIVKGFVSILFLRTYESRL